MKERWKRAAAIGLAAILLTAQTPVSVYAEEAGEQAASGEPVIMQEMTAASEAPELPENETATEAPELPEPVPNPATRAIITVRTAKAP